MRPSKRKRNPTPRAAGRASGRNFAAANFQFESNSPLPLDLQEGPRSGRDLNAEARIQAAIVAWVRAVAPELLIFAVPNGGLRSKAEAARMKWTGVLAGVPDLVIVAPGGRAYFIEVKPAAGRLSPDQLAILDALLALGTPPAICRSIDDTRRAFAAWGLETREATRV
jgi:hypothetical protein